MALSRCRDERFRGIDGAHGSRAEPLDQLRRKCAGSATHIEHALTNHYICQRRELGSERNGVAAHEPVIRFGCDREAHPGNLRLTPPQAPVPDCASRDTSETRPFDGVCPCSMWSAW